MVAEHHISRDIIGILTHHRYGVRVKMAGYSAWATCSCGWEKYALSITEAQDNHATHVYGEIAKVLNKHHFMSAQLHTALAMDIQELHVLIGRIAKNGEVIDEGAIRRLQRFQVDQWPAAMDIVRHRLGWST